MHKHQRDWLLPVRILDGCSRCIVNGDLQESMTEADIEITLERAKELQEKVRTGLSQ